MTAKPTSKKGAGKDKVPVGCEKIGTDGSRDGHIHVENITLPARSMSALPEAWVSHLKRYGLVIGRVPWHSGAVRSGPTPVREVDDAIGTAPFHC